MPSAEAQAGRARADHLQFRRDHGFDAADLLGVERLLVVGSAADKLQPGGVDKFFQRLRIAFDEEDVVLLEVLTPRRGIRRRPP